MFEAALVIPAAMAVGDFARSSRNVSERGTSASRIERPPTQGDIHRDVRTRRKVVIDLSRFGVLEDHDGGDITPLADASKRGLASDDSAWITGEQILAGGGLR